MLPLSSPMITDKIHRSNSYVGMPSSVQYDRLTMRLELELVSSVKKINNHY